MARPRRPDAPPLARARGGRVLRDVLLRLGDAVLSGPRRSGAATARRGRAEQELCSFWRDWELELLRPRLIVTVGGLALRRLLGLTSLTPCVGERYELRRDAGRPAPPPLRRERLAQPIRRIGSGSRRRAALVREHLSAVYPQEE